MLKFLSIAFAISFIFTFSLMSADFYQLQAAAAGVNGSLIINEHAVCNGVSNASTSVYFIPTRTASEWANFRNNPPPGVTIYNCCAKVC